MHGPEVQLVRFLGWTLEISKNARNRKKNFPVYAEIFGHLFTQLLFFYLFKLIFQEDEEYLVAWRVRQVQDTLEKPMSSLVRAPV